MPRGSRRLKKRDKAEQADWLAERKEASDTLAKLAKVWTIEGILEELGITLKGDLDQLEEFLGLIKGQHRALDQLLEGIVDSQELDNWAPGDFLLAIAEERNPTLEEIIDWKGLNRVEIAGGLAAASLTVGVTKAKVILAQALPAVIKAAVDSATLGEGAVAQADRKLLLEAGGLMPKGPQTMVQINNNNTVMGLPKFQEADKAIENIFFGKGQVRGTDLEMKLLEDGSRVVDAEVDLVPGEMEVYQGMWPEEDLAQGSGSGSSNLDNQMGVAEYETTKAGVEQEGQDWTETQVSSTEKAQAGADDRDESGAPGVEVWQASLPDGLLGQGDLEGTSRGDVAAGGGEGDAGVSEESGGAGENEDGHDADWPEYTGAV